MNESDEEGGRRRRICGKFSNFHPLLARGLAFRLQLGVTPESCVCR
jgi:hypothetical protein